MSTYNINSRNNNKTNVEADYVELHDGYFKFYKGTEVIKYYTAEDVHSVTKENHLKACANG